METVFGQSLITIINMSNEISNKVKKIVADHLGIEEAKGYGSIKFYR